MIKIAITGPESTGKTTLSTALAESYQTAWVPEYARSYIDQLDRPYEQKDLLIIAKEQVRQEEAAIRNANRLIFCDTDLTVIKIWSEHKYGSCDPEILKLLKQQHYDLYLLTGLDIPWEEDDQREHPHLREFFYAWYKKELTALQVNLVEIQGDTIERMKLAKKAIDTILTA
ncbi:MAG: ATP-binding protein [Bacteroidota bacterium]